MPKVKELPKEKVPEMMKMPKVKMQKVKELPQDKMPKGEKMPKVKLEQNPAVECRK